MSKYLYIYFVFPILLSVPAALPLLQVLIPFGNKRFVDARPAGRFSPEVLSMKWFRWYHGTVDDRKWLVVSRHCGQSRAVVLAVWCALLEFASQAEERGSIAAFDCESLDALLGVEDGVCAAVMRAFVRKGLVSGGRLTAWDKRQPRREDEDAVDRQRRRRQRLVLPPAQVASLAVLLAEEAISSNQAHEVFGIMAETGNDPAKIVDERGMRQVSDDDALLPVVEQVIDSCPDQVQQYRDGNQKVIGYLVGQCMKASRGKGNPKRFNELLREKIG